LNALPAGAERSALFERRGRTNFHMQLRAIYSWCWMAAHGQWLVGGRSADSWRMAPMRGLNGMDEFAVMVGIIPLGGQAGRRMAAVKRDVLRKMRTATTSGRAWSSTFSESHLGLLGLIKEFKANPESAAFVGVTTRSSCASDPRVRARPGFDARAGFDVHVKTQRWICSSSVPGASLTRIAERKWNAGWASRREHV